MKEHRRNSTNQPTAENREKTPAGNQERHPGRKNNPGVRTPVIAHAQWGSAFWWSIFFGFLRNCARKRDRRSRALEDYFPSSPSAMPRISLNALTTACVHYHRGANAGVVLSPWMSLLDTGRGFLPVLGGWLVGAVPAVLFHIEVGDFR